MRSKYKNIHAYIYLPLFLVIAFFVASRFYPILSKVPIKIGIEDGATIPEGVISLVGRAHKATNLYINGKSTSVTKEGEFEEPIALPAGYNIVTVEAEDKFGKRNKKIITVHVEGQQSENRLGLK